MVEEQGGEMRDEHGGGKRGNGDEGLEKARVRTGLPATRRAGRGGATTMLLSRAVVMAVAESMQLVRPLSRDALGVRSSAK